MEDWQRVIEERNRMTRIIHSNLDKNVDQKKIIRRRIEEEKKGVFDGEDEEGICFWRICVDFVVGDC